MTDKLRKYVLPNIPYVFIGWVFLKLALGGSLAALILDYRRRERERKKSK